MNDSAHPLEPDLARRFGGIARLYGQTALARFQQAHVLVIGVGGVGSWAVETLARSAIGQLTLMDMDHVAESNINRQIQALSSTIGAAKIETLARRITEINPACRVNLIDDFLNAQNVSAYLCKDRFDYVIDAIDDVPAKVALIAHCRKHSIPLMTVGSAGGQTDPTQIEIRDLSRTEQEPLLARVRKQLRAHHGFPRGTKNKFGIEAVFSMEPLTLPAQNGPCATDAAATGLNCAGFGSSMAVTAGFGMTAAAGVLDRLATQASSGERCD